MNEEGIFLNPPRGGQAHLRRARVNKPEAY